MRLVINIPNEIYEHAKDKTEDSNDEWCGMRAIAEGNILPNNHGKLAILSIDKLKENLIDLSFSCQQWISEVGLSCAIVSTIEADKETEK